MERVSASKFKAKLGKYMRAVRLGRGVVVTDRDQPVARFVPIEPREAVPRRASTSTPRDEAALPLGEIEVASIEYDGPSITDQLLEDRER